MRRHWFDPVEERWMFREVPATEEQALRFLRSAPGAEAYLKVYREWRVLGAGVEAALLRVSAFARETEEAEERRDDAPRGPSGT